MNSIEIAILNYENQLLANRKQLNDLIYEYHNQNASHSLLNYKINYLQNEMDYMSRQLEILKAELEGQPEMSHMQIHDAAQPSAPSMQLPDGAQASASSMQSSDGAQAPASSMQPADKPQAPVSSMQSSDGAQANASSMQTSNRAQAPASSMPPQGRKHFFTSNTQAQDAAPSKPMDLENIIGKSWMGIFASVLIFVSFILFATLLAPFITDTMKMAAMYLVSAIFTSFGLIKLKKHHNRLYLAISSCGVGAIYISLLLTNLYFKAIGDIALYLLILIWAVFVCYLSRWQDKVFQIIGQCGITIALFFGVILCVETEDTAKFFLLSIFFVVTAAIFYISSYSREFHKNIIHNIFNIINVFQLLVSFCLFDMPDLFSPDKLSLGWTSYQMEFVSIVILLFLVMEFVLFLTARLKETNTGFGLVIVANALLLMLSIISMTYGSDDDFRGTVFLIIGFFLMTVIEKKFDNRTDSGKVLIQLFILPLFIFSVYMISFFENHIGLSFLMILFVLLGYYKNDTVYKSESLIMAFLYCFSAMKYPTEQLCLGLLFFALLAVLMYIKKEQYHITFKLFSYFMGLLFLFAGLAYLLNDTNVSYDAFRTIIFTAIAVINLIAMKSTFIKDFRTMQIEKTCVTATRILNAVFMAYSLYAIMDINSGICHYILILLAVCLFMVNTRNLLKQHKGLLPGIYIGIKLTVLIITILSSFDAANYIISISTLLFAIISIIAGFKFFFKSFRIYGLTLSLISVAKLILVDISYDNTLGHALSFFVCGVLCFVISMIYHLIDKRMRDK